MIRVPHRAGTLLGTDEADLASDGPGRALGAGPAGSGWTQRLLSCPPTSVYLRAPGEPGAGSDGGARDCGEQAPWGEGGGYLPPREEGRPVPSHDGEQSGHAV